MSVTCGLIIQDVSLNQSVSFFLVTANWMSLQTHINIIIHCEVCALWELYFYPQTHEIVSGVSVHLSHWFEIVMHYTKKHCFAVKKKDYSEYKAVWDKTSSCWICLSFCLLQMLTDGLECCDVFIRLILTAPIHCRASIAETFLQTGWRNTHADLKFPPSVCRSDRQESDDVQLYLSTWESLKDAE